MAFSDRHATLARSMTKLPTGPFDVAIVGMGIVGLAHAYWAAQAGCRVVLLDGQSRPSGASIRNFGFITVTGQSRELWNHAQRSAKVWRSLAPKAGIPILQEGLTVIAQCPEAAAVLEGFAASEMGEGCQLLPGTAIEPAQNFTGPVEAILKSPFEFRVNPRTAVPALRQWLASEYDVVLVPNVQVSSAEPKRLETPHGHIQAKQIFLCTGDAPPLLELSSDADRKITRCKLQMLRLADPGFRLPTPLFSDLSLIRYGGFAALPETVSLRQRLETEHPEMIQHGIHLIVGQDADGTLVVGDSHTYDASPDPFHSNAIDALILQAFSALMPSVPATVIERWIGTYAYSPNCQWFAEEALPGVTVTQITSGAGMSTAFAIAEDVVLERL